jgi:hypothetical protein
MISDDRRRDPGAVPGASTKTQGSWASAGAKQDRAALKARGRPDSVVE